MRGLWKPRHGTLLQDDEPGEGVGDKRTPRRGDPSEAKKSAEIWRNNNSNNRRFWPSRMPVFQNPVRPFLSQRPAALEPASTGLVVARSPFLSNICKKRDVLVETIVVGQKPDVV